MDAYEKKDPAGAAAFYENIQASIMRGFHAWKENVHPV